MYTFFLFFFFGGGGDKVVKLVSVGSVSNGTTPSDFRTFMTNASQNWSFIGLILRTHSCGQMNNDLGKTETQPVYSVQCPLCRSVLDGKPMDGISSLRIHSGPDMTQVGASFLDR